MSILNQLKDFFKGNKTTSDAPEGFCPNCWGREEYGGKFYTAVKKEKIDLNNVEKNKGWINAYAAKHLEGIKLHKEGDHIVCSSCKLTYKAE